jgi:hypothetical protein
MHITRPDHTHQDTIILLATLRELVEIIVERAGEGEE